MNTDANCFVPTAAAADRVLDSQRAVRYAALLQLIDEIQCRRTVADVAQVVASRWKHCANVSQWRLLCMHRGRASLITTQGRDAAVHELCATELSPWDAEQWQRLLPSYTHGEQLRALRPGLPAELADGQAGELAILPVQQGEQTIALLAAISNNAAFDMLDRKFLGHVAGAMAGRINAIMTEQALAAELRQAEHEALQNRHAAMLGRLVNGVAHELNTPLGVQISACDALAAGLQRAQTGAAQDLLSTVALVGEQARRCAGIVRRLKQISGASQRSPRLPTQVLATIESIAITFAGRIDAPQMALSGPEDLRLEIDREALALLLSEIIDNARVHARRPDGPCELSFELHAVDGKVWLDINDNGPGMPDAVAARFFEPFFTTRQAQGHMGLGGYIVRSLARDALQAQVSLLRTTCGVGLRLEFEQGSRQSVVHPAA